MNGDDFREKLREKILYWNQEVRDEDVFDFTEYDLAEYIEKNDSFKLYRYMPADYFNIRNIETQKIHLSNCGVMNDLYEGLPTLSDLEKPNPDITSLDDLAIMTCFSENNNNTLMWSHYADSHKGFCLEYDLKRIKKDPFEIKKHLFPIVYNEKRLIRKNIESIIEDLKEIRRAMEEQYMYDGKELLDDLLPLFLTKGIAWSYEQEWRIIYTKKHLYDIDNKTLSSGNIPFACISAVYLGYRIHPEIRNHILDICSRISTSEYRVEVYQEVLDEEGYNIVFNKV